MFSLGNVTQVENTPLVVEGIMYVSSANECWALDAGTGRMLWHYQRAKTRGVAGNAAIGFNRGVAWAGDSGELWVLHATQVYRLDWRNNRIVSTFAHGGTPGNQSIATDGACAPPWFDFQR